MFDGWKSQEIRLEHPQYITGKQTHRVYRPLLCVGHVSIDPEYSSQILTLSSLMIFEGKLVIHFILPTTSYTYVWC